MQHRTPKSTALTLDTILDFGKYEGEQIEDIIEDDPNYITWMYEHNFEFDDEAIKKLEEKKII